MPASPNDALRLKVEAVLSGEVEMRDLDEAELEAVHAEIAARIAERVMSAAFGEELLAAGDAAVSLDADGRSVEHRPDGSIVVIDRP